MTWDFKTVLIGFLCLSFAIFVVVHEMKVNSLQKDKVSLQNALAKSQETVKIKDGVYMKATEEIDNLKSLLDNSNKQVHALTQYIDKMEEKYVYLASAYVKLNKAYEAVLNASQTQDPNNPPIDPNCTNECLKLRTRVDFEKELGPFKLTGHTLTNPAEAAAKLEQVRPFVLKLVVTKTKSGLWKTYVVSPDNDLQVQIDASGIDTSVFKRKWYEKIGLAASIGLGNGIYSSVGLTYDFNGLSVGPTYGFTDRGQMVGLTAIWRPFFSNEK